MDRIKMQPYVLIGDDDDESWVMTRTIVRIDQHGEGSYIRFESGYGVESLLSPKVLWHRIFYGDYNL